VSRGGHGAADASSDEFAHPGESQYIDESQYKIVNRLYEATHSRRLQDVRALVHEDVTFVGPAMKATGSREYMAAIERLLGFQNGRKRLHQFEDGDDVCSLYELSVITPAGASLTLPIADRIQVKNGKIAAHLLRTTTSVKACNSHSSQQSRCCRPASGRY
jgi:hypothetical protein